MNQKQKKHNKPHKIKAKKHITFMMIPDPTKSARIINIPKWLRYPVCLIIIISILAVINSANKMSDLKKQLAQEQYNIETNEAAIEDREAIINKLENELQIATTQNSEKLETVESLASELNQKLTDLEVYKEGLDSKLNDSGQTVTAQPSEVPVTEEAAAIVAFAENGSTEQNISVFEQDVFDKDVDDLINQLTVSLSELEEDKAEYEALNLRLDELIPYWDAYPSGSPVDYIRLSDSFGWRRDPINFSWDFHTGVDLYAKYQPVYATGKGVVVASEYKNGYGYTVDIDHGYGYITRYAHNSKLLVEVGDIVERGDQVSVSGASGRVTGAHLHYEVIYNGEIKDPMEFINK